VYNRFGVPSLFVTAVTRSRAQAGAGVNADNVNLQMVGKSRSSRSSSPRASWWGRDWGFAGSR